MLASAALGITRTDDDDWFDPILDSDTPLGVDPFLIFQTPEPPWDDAHDELVGYFNQCFLYIASGISSVNSPAYRKAVDLLRFPEPKEFCLGYTRSGTAGSGGGIGSARTIAAAMAEAIRRGMENIRHFEELGVIHEKIGMDRISDMTLNILKRRFILYTQDVAKRHSLQVDEHVMRGARYNMARDRWERATVEVPTNPYGSGPLLLTPAKFLSHLPVLNADEFWDFYEGEQLRNDLNYRVMGRVNKAYIIGVARQHPDAIRRWTLERERRKAQGYNFEKDPKGIWQWDMATAEYVRAHPITISLPNDEGGFFEAIELVNRQFKQYVTQGGGWGLLWNDDGSEKDEEAAQLLYKGIVQYYCHANNIVVDREVELGRGPVDFKFSNGYENRALLEVKKLHNGKFWQGIQRQLPSYLNSDDCKDGWFMAIRYRDGEHWDERWRDLPEIARQIADEHGLRLRVDRIDARRPPSASKL
jgi:hypothetical protein